MATKSLQKFPEVRTIDEAARKKIANAEPAEFEDVTLEELRQDWLRASSKAGRHDAPKNAQAKAKKAKKTYFEALAKEQQMGKRT